MIVDLTIDEASHILWLVEQSCSDSDRMTSDEKSIHRKMEALLKADQESRTPRGDDEIRVVQEALAKHRGKR